MNLGTPPQIWYRSEHQRGTSHPTTILESLDVWSGFSDTESVLGFYLYVSLVVHTWAEFPIVAYIVILQTPSTRLRRRHLILGVLLLIDEVADQEDVTHVDEDAGLDAGAPTEAGARGGAIGEMERFPLFGYICYFL